MSRSQKPVGLYFQFKNLSAHSPGQGWEDEFGTRFGGEAASAVGPWGFRETLQSALGFRIFFLTEKGGPSCSGGRSALSPFPCRYLAPVYLGVHLVQPPGLAMADLGPDLRHTLLGSRDHP